LGKEAEAGGNGARKGRVCFKLTKKNEWLFMQGGGFGESFQVFVLLKQMVVNILMRFVKVFFSA
jgi:hypothetical protein